MTEKQFRAKVRSMKGEISAMIDNRVGTVLRSGCVDLNEFDNDFLLPKIFMSAIGGSIRAHFEPSGKLAKKERDNIDKFV